MKSLVAVVLVVALCSQICLIETKSTTTLPGVTSTTTTVKPWTQKFKDGFGKFLQGAAVVSAAQQGFQNARGGSKHKGTHTGPSPSTHLKN